MWLADPYRTRFLYTDYLDLGLAHHPSREGRALHRPRRRVGAEADVARLSRACGCRWSSSIRRSSTPPIAGSRCRASPGSTVDVDDGRQWLTRHDERWDVIVIDAFYADSIPFHLATHEFLELVRDAPRAGRRRRREHHRSDHAASESKLLRSLTKTYRSSFPTVLLYPVYDDRRATAIPPYTRNVILVATDGAAPTTAVPAAALAGDPQGDADGARARQGDRGPVEAARALRRRAGADRRLRADRRAAAV